MPNDLSVSIIFPLTEDVGDYYGSSEDPVLNSRRAREALQHGTTLSVALLHSSFIVFEWIHCHLAKWPDARNIHHSILKLEYTCTNTGSSPTETHIGDMEAFELQIGPGLQAGLSKSTPSLYPQSQSRNDRCQ